MPSIVKQQSSLILETPTGEKATSPEFAKKKKKKMIELTSGWGRGNGPPVKQPYAHNKGSGIWL